MAPKIKWTNNYNIEISLIRELEKKWGIHFPDLFFDIVSQHDGAAPLVEYPTGDFEIGVISVSEKISWEIRRPLKNL